MKTARTCLGRIIAVGMAALLLIGALPLSAMATDDEIITDVGSAEILQSAVQNPEGIIRLSGDIVLQEPLKVSKDVTIDLNSREIRASYTTETKDPRATIIVEEDGSLTLLGDGKVWAPGKIDAEEEPEHDRYALCVNGSLTVGGSVSILAENDDDKSFLITLFNGAKLTLQDNVTVSGGVFGIKVSAGGPAPVISVAPDKMISVSSGNPLSLNGLLLETIT